MTKLREWAEVEKEFFTPEEIKASNSRIASIGELTKATNEKGTTKEKLEKLSEEDAT